MIPIPGATFDMGSDTLGQIDEQPKYKVTISQFYLDRYEITNLKIHELR